MMKGKLNSKGQRLLIAYGNNTMTRYAYDPQTFALKRQLTEGYAQTGYTFTPQSGTKKQDTSTITILPLARNAITLNLTFKKTLISLFKIANFT